MGNKPSSYRPDIDGLRAIAILAVILFHFEVPGFSGGFVGVDVFFVISGFLIIRIIMREIAEGEFSLISFWERRVRRIIPAMAVVLMATAVASYYRVILPSDLASFGHTLMMQSAFLSNLWFMGLNDYFAAPLQTVPLLHTWTLAIEEQFYILIPLVLVALQPFVKSRLRLVLVFLAVVSFINSVILINVMPDERFGATVLPHLWGTATNATAGFYFLLPRLWEFLVGGVVAVYALRLENKKLAQLVSAAGLLMILTSVLFFSEETAFPGLAALMPVLGTAAVIVANTKNRTEVKSLLSLPLMVGVGLISYSLYLWHWPVLVLARYQLLPGEEMPFSQTLFILMLIVGLSVATYRFVETPVRRRQVLKNRSVLFIVAAVCLIGLFAAGKYIEDNNGFPDRLSLEAQLMAAAVDDVNPRTDECLTKSGVGARSNEPCLLGADSENGQVDFVLWGDSHADAAMPAFEEYGRLTGKTGVFFGLHTCPPLVSNHSLSKEAMCTQTIIDALSYIDEHKPEEVFIVSEWRSQYNFVDNPEMGYYLYDLLPITLSAFPEETKVTIFQRLPTFPDFSFRTQVIEEVRGISTLILEHPRANFVDPIQVHHEQMVKSLVDYPDVNLLDPIDTLCDDKYCYIGTEEALFYHDSSHLSTYGARKIVLPLLLKDDNER